MTETMTPELVGPVLVVDDDRLVLRMVARVLRDRGIEVHLEERALGLIDRIGQIRPALILLDVHMPGLDGAALTAKMRQDPVLADSRIVLYSGLDEQSLAERAQACGADGYVQKVAPLGGLAQTVLRWLSKQPNQQR
jgi:CheY-like chemotaxis protein